MPATATRRDPLLVAAENAERDPFTRRRLPLRTVTAALAQLDEQRATITAALATFDAALAARSETTAGYIAEPVGDAWNALHDAADALDRLRATIEENRRPIPEHERGTWELVKDNID